MRRHMDWTGNIIEVSDEKPIDTIETSEGTEVALRDAICDQFEQHLANINQDEEDMDLVEGPCQYESSDLIMCPNFFAAPDDPDTPDVIECQVCGRMDWKKKPSIGRNMGEEKLV